MRLFMQNNSGVEMGVRGRQLIAVRSGAVVICRMEVQPTTIPHRTHIRRCAVVMAGPRAGSVNGAGRVPTA